MADGTRLQDPVILLRFSHVDEFHVGSAVDGTHRRMCHPTWLRPPLSVAADASIMHPAVSRHRFGSSHRASSRRGIKDSVQEDE